jgi:hypothetical protein
MQQTSDIFTPYYRPDPEKLIQVIESTGLLGDGRLLTLNSYESIGRIKGVLPKICRY